VHLENFKFPNFNVNGFFFLSLMADSYEANPKQSIDACSFVLPLMADT